MTKLQKLKEIIRVANPKLIVMKVKISEEEFAQIANGTDSFDYTKYLVYPDITIGDVLNAIKKKLKYENDECSIRWKEDGINIICGGVFPCDHDKEVKNIFKFWNLLHDLDWHAKNRPNMIDFLYNLLYDK